MSSRISRSKKYSVIRRLDDFTQQFAREHGIREFYDGVHIIPDEHGDPTIDSGEAERLAEIIGSLPDKVGSEILEMLEMLELIKTTPNYDELKTIINNKISTIEKPKVVFMLGAGASKPEPSNIPTINEMLDVIVSKLPPVENPMQNKIREWAKRRNITIEDIMTAGYISSNLVSDTTIHSLVGEIIYRTPIKEESRNIYREPELRDVEYVISFKDLMDTVFSTVSGIMIKAEPNEVHNSIAKLIKNTMDYYDISILTTNYDVCMEKALRKNKLDLNYLWTKTEKGVPIIKIHGSLNWYYCEGCQDVIIYGINEIDKFDKMYPTTASCMKCNTLTKLFMIPPIAYKYVMFPPIVEIWQNAMQILESADVIIVIGYSFSLSDDYILKMIVNGMKRKSSLFILMNISDTSVKNLENRLLSYHERINMPIIEDASISVPIVTEIMENLYKNSSIKEN